ncbi:hypothetical protein Tco_0199513 [Tanacetum coccineum]|uniref:Uncharacterized protein n=1 Tax=Tanacetum coccineum TaxID=301880 RepID=A0ABQ4X343_9ASTR
MDRGARIRKGRHKGGEELRSRRERSGWAAERNANRGTLARQDRKPSSAERDKEKAGRRREILKDEGGSREGGADGHADVKRKRKSLSGSTRGQAPGERGPRERQRGERSRERREAAGNTKKTGGKADKDSPRAEGGVEERNRGGKGRGPDSVEPKEAPPGGQIRAPEDVDRRHQETRVARGADRDRREGRASP